MQAPMNEYYTDEEYQYALKQMYQMMERNRIITEAKLAITAKNKLKEKPLKYVFSKNIYS